MRLIDADKLIAHLEDEIDECKIPFDSRANGKGIAYGTALGLKSAISFAKTAPTVDIKTEVAEVVRCKECKYWEATDDGISRNNKGRTDGACERLWSIHCAERHLTERDHYCGYGRHKTQKEGVGK